MKTGILIAAILFLTANRISSQVYLDPNPILCAYNFFQSEKLYIEKIELTKTATIVHCECAVSSEWANVGKDAFIASYNGESYHLLKTEGLPIEPERYYFKESDHTFKFKMYFESIPDTLRVFDIIESRKDGNCFNALNVSLDLSNERANYIAKYLRDNIPYKLWQFFFDSFREHSIDELFYQELLKDEKAFSIEDKYFDPDSVTGDFYKRIICFKYNGNKIMTVFNAKKQSFNLLHVSVDFVDQKKADDFIREFSCLFHMKKESDELYYLYGKFYRFITKIKDDMININYGDIIELSNNKKLL
jgi:hypothetical protein